VEVQSGTLGEPVPDERRLMGALVIQDDVGFQFGGHLGLDQIQELAKFRGAVTAVEFTDHARLVFNSSAANSAVVPWRLSSWVRRSAWPGRMGNSG
jgi:hypothetical protein